MVGVNKLNGKGDIIMKIKKIIAIITVLSIIFASLPAFADNKPTENTFTILSASPYDGARNVSPVNLKVDVTFSESVDKSTLTINNVSVTNNALGGVVATSDKTATIYLNRREVALDEKYTVTLKSGIKAMSGASLEETKITFSTTRTAPKYRQISNSDMSDINNKYAYRADTLSGIVDDNGNPVLKYKLAWAEATVSQRVYVEGGKTYTARVKVKSDTTQKIWMALPYNAPGDANFYHGGTRITVSAGEWVTLEEQWTLPANADVESRISILVAAEKASSTVYIDDLQFYEGNNDIEDPTVSLGAGNVGFTHLSETRDLVEKFKALGVINSGASANSLVSRIDLAAAILKLYDLDAIGLSADELPFTDVDEGDKLTVSTVHKLGIMNGYSNTMFGPYDTATTEQVIKTVVTALGYNPVVQVSDDPLKTYMNIALELGLLKGVSVEFGKEVTFSEFVSILNNALEKEVLVPEHYGDFGELQLVKGDTLLENGLKVVMKRGVIEGTDRTYLYKESALRENQVCIDGVIYECDVDLNPYLGCEVEFYYEESDNLDKIIYICGILELNDIVEFSSCDDYIEYSKNTYTHIDGENKEKTYSISKDKNVIYNGEYLGSYTDEVFTPVYGSVKLIKNDGSYSTVMITDIKTITVGRIDSENMTVYDEFSSDYVTFRDSKDYLVFVDEEGFETDFGGIKIGNTISVIQSKKGTSSYVHISQKSIEGSVVAVQQESDVYWITIGDMIYGTNVRAGEFKTIQNYFDYDQIDIGKEGIFKFDFMGRLASFGDTKTRKKIGYLIDACVKERLDATTHFKIFTENGEMLYLDGAERIKIDGKNYKKPQEMMTALSKGSSEVVSQLVIYDTNSENELSFIDTAYNKIPNCDDYRLIKPTNGESDDSFKVTYSSVLPPNSVGNEIKFIGNGRTFDHKVQLAATPTIFVVPFDAKNDDEIKFAITKNYWDLGNEWSSSIESYQVDSNSFETKYLVVYIDDDNYHLNYKNRWSYGIVKDIRYVLYNEESVARITFTDDKVVYTDSTGYMNGIELGDFIQYKADRLSYLISKPEIYFDRSSQTTIANPNGTILGYDTMYLVNVHEIRGSVLNTVLPSVNIYDEDEVKLNSILIDCSKANVWIYDGARREELRKGTIDDILDYVTTGSDYSECLIITSQGTAKEILILNQQ